MTLAEILAKLTAYNETVADASALDFSDLDPSRAAAREALLAFDAYRSSGDGVEITTELVEAAKAVRSSFDVIETRLATETDPDVALAEAVDSIFDGIDLADAAEPDVAEPEAEPADEPEAEPADEAVAEPEMVTASRTIAYRRPTPAAMAGTAEAEPEPEPEPAGASFLVASSDGGVTPHVLGRTSAGGAFNGVEVDSSENPLALAEAVGFTAAEMLTAGRFRNDGRTGLVAARFPGRGHAGTIGRGMDGDAVADLARSGAASAFGGDHLTAAAGQEPITYTYGFAGQGVSARMPVWDSRVRYDTTRSRFGIRLRDSLMDYEPADPSADYPDGMGHFTLADDVAGNTKVDPSTVPNTEDETFEISAFYRSVEITNLEALTDPEKVNQSLNLGGVAFTRASERDIIDEMLTLPGAIYIEAAAGSYGLTGTTREVVPILREQIEELEYQEGFDSGLGYELITLDWVRTAIANDLWRRNTESYDQQSGPVEKYLLDTLNITPVFSKVGSSGRRSGYRWTETKRLPSDSSFDAETGEITWGAHEVTPNQMDYILAPRGTIQAVDRGFLQVGVAPWGDGVGSVIRDSTTAYGNKFRVFWELVRAVFSTGMPYIVGTISGLNDDGAGVATRTPITVAS
jgi:hypothetical protein